MNTKKKITCLILFFLLFAFDSKAKEKDTLNVISEEEQPAYGVAFDHKPWAQATSDLYEYYIHERKLEDAKKVMEVLLLEYPTNESFYEKAANICGQLKDTRNAALLYFTKAFNFDASFDKARDILVLYLQLDEPEKALPYINYAIQNNASGFDLNSLKMRADEVIQLKQTTEKDSSNKQALN
jgi:hypothetical protein